MQPPPLGASMDSQIASPHNFNGLIGNPCVTTTSGFWAVYAKMVFRLYPSYTPVMFDRSGQSLAGLVMLATKGPG